MDGFPSGQRERTVNPLSQTTMVRIHPRPPNPIPHAWGIGFGKMRWENSKTSLSTRMRAWRNWQTRTVQVRMGATPWRFKSSCPHQCNNNFCLPGKSYYFLHFGTKNSLNQAFSAENNNKTGSGAVDRLFRSPIFVPVKAKTGVLFVFLYICKEIQKGSGQEDLNLKKPYIYWLF